MQEGSRELPSDQTKEIVMGATATRKAVAGQSTAKPSEPLVGTFIAGGTLGAVAGRGRKADALPAALVAQLEQMVTSGGAAEASGTAQQVDKLKRQIMRWVKERNDAGQPTDKGFRTLSKNDKGQQTGIRYSVFSVEVAESK